MNMSGKELLCCMAFLALLAFEQGSSCQIDSFARPSGTSFLVNGLPFYANGFNAYWLMDKAFDPYERDKVTSAMKEASSYGLTIVRTWAFSDGGGRALQISPGNYNEEMFKALDFVVSEASKYGLRLILCLVNNWSAYGGKYQYVQWARNAGQYVNSEDDFFSNDVVKSFYKNHIKKVLTRINTITGVAYKDDPTIFAWELMNEPRCQSDLSGRTLQAWISEMAAYVKSVDSSHMLDVGMEGFYGESTPERKQFNPGYEVGSDFISNHQVPDIDFATIHAYPEQWAPGLNEEGQQAFLEKWLESHIQDAGDILKKPLIVEEFGKSSRGSGFTVAKRDAFYSTIYDSIYASARVRGPGAGGLFWQLLAQGMDGNRDGYEIIFSECPASTVDIISQQSHRMAALNN
ncbi:Mannan endo-1,4-beta-mannosidase protein [Dioscorea alata]|uniref:Mannan endo-1,4-beta-mannosidase protein n=1 Tax=Dioscorea alata TaxID=55571 RepID=A0ACB7V056_DIOAL|nr:Mannan endo-1,4-beta-mannosidase protein [Dioscorea alata]